MFGIPKQQQKGFYEPQSSGDKAKKIECHLHNYAVKSLKSLLELLT